LELEEFDDLGDAVFGDGEVFRGEAGDGVAVLVQSGVQHSYASVIFLAPDHMSPVCSSGKFSLANSPYNSRAFLSYARAAASSVGYVPK
jgi:hypothetical protein